MFKSFYVLFIYLFIYIYIFFSNFGCLFYCSFSNITSSPETLFFFSKLYISMFSDGKLDFYLQGIDWVVKSRCFK